jgi:hypothetical protein
MNLIDILQSAVKTDAEQYAQFGTVSGVDSDTCTVEPLNGDAPINKVKLSAGETDEGFILTPVVGSVVLVVFSSKTRAFVSMCSEVETVQIRGEQHGGVVIAPELQTQLERMTARIDAIGDALKNTAPDSATGTFKTSLTPGITAFAALPSEDFKNIQNENVKHG